MFLVHPQKQQALLIDDLGDKQPSHEPQKSDRLNLAFDLLELQLFQLL